MTLLVPSVMAGLVVLAAPARAAGAVSATGLPGSGFPLWYQDSSGRRVEPCIAATDANCVLPPTSATYDPTQPLLFPTNYPDEFFYSLAGSDLVATPGCAGTAPGRASVRLAVEGAFANGAPAGGDQTTFGRIRVKVTSGLCPNTTYQFKHPFATVSLTTNALGGIPANVGTVDVGCVPAPGLPCDFAKANASPVMGTAAAGGFLRWDPTVAPAAPAGYLGDGVTLHSITGGTNGNTFEILNADGTATGMTTNQFSVMGKVAGPLLASPSPLDFGGVPVGTSVQKTITVTNVDPATIAFAGNPARLRAGVRDFTVNSTTCRSLTRDAACTITVSFRPSGVAPVSDFVDLAYTGAIRSPLSIQVTGSGTTAGNQPRITAAPGSLAFGDVRLRTTSTLRLTVTNSGNAALSVNTLTIGDAAFGEDASQYRLLAQSCTGRSIVAAGTCTVDVSFAPFSRGPHPATLTIASNISGGLTRIALTANATGGVAAVSPTVAADDGFPDWYRDENGVKLSQCIDPKDPYCVVLPDATFTPAQPVRFPTNFPGEYFYTVSDSNLVSTPGCNGSAPGKAMLRNAIEGTFVTGSPVVDEQMVFGRERITVSSGLCPNTAYTFVTPYGKTSITTNAAGGVTRKMGTEDVGCAPLPPDKCDFQLALSATIFGGALRWDPAVAPAAPAGYLGDAATFHRVVGAPYSEDGVAPANYFKILGPGGAVVGQTDQFTVMGKLRGPLEATAGLDATGRGALPETPVGATSSPVRLTLTNTGTAVGASDGSLTVTSAAVGGTDAADFSVVGTTCSGTALAVGATCTVDVTFSPRATGDRAATLVVRHSGLNDPFAVPLVGVGGAGAGTSAVSFAPRSLAFGDLATGRTSKVETVTVSNAGGTADLTVTGVAVSGATPQYTVTSNQCAGRAVAPDSSCTISVAFTPTAAGNAAATLVITDNAPGGTHSLPLSGSGFGGTTAVSATVDRNGFPNWYQDANGTRLEPCLDASNCIVLADAGFDPAQPLTFPANFPSEFFYAVADSQLVQLDGCGGTSLPGTALLRLALEGSFVNGSPVAGEQTTFTRMRLFVKSGLCPNVTYNAVTPYGTFAFATDATGGLVRNAGTQDVGCPAAVGTPCTFVDALATPGPAMPNSQTPIAGFLRWDPNVGTAPPAGYLGDAVSFRKVIGGTYVEAGAQSPYNGFRIDDLAGNTIGATDDFMLAGKVAGPLLADHPSLDFGHVNVGAAGAGQTVTVTNVAGTATGVTPTLSGPGAAQFRITGGTCTGAPVNPDATCTVNLQYAPSVAGPSAASLILTPGSGRTATVALTGVADAVGTPAISVTPGVLSFGTVTAPGSGSVTATISNATGTAPLVISAGALSGGAAADFAVTATTCPAGGALWTIPAGASCTVTVRFTPSAIGSRTGALTLTHNAAGGSTAVSLTGTGAGAAWSVSPSPVGFGTVNRGTAKTSSLSVRNSGTANGRITSAVIANAVPAGAAFTVVVNPAQSTCLNGTAVAPGKSCTLIVSFTPPAAGTYGANLVITDAAALPVTTPVALTGTGK